MTTQRVSPPRRLEPVVCTLSDDQAATRVVEWSDLRRLATDVVPVAGGARMTFPVEHEDAIAELAAAEASCCAFLAITTRVRGGELILEVTSENPDAAPVIAALAGIEPLAGA